MEARRGRKIRVAAGFLVAPFTVAAVLMAYATATGAGLSADFVVFCVATGYVAALLFGLPLHLLVLRKGRRRGAVAYAVSGAAIGLAAYGVIAAFLTIHALVTLAFADVVHFVYLTRFFALVGMSCGAASGLVFWVVAVRDGQSA